jgi:hypothetical protein
MFGVGFMEMLVLAVCALGGIGGLVGVGFFIWHANRNKDNSSSQENEP